MVRLEKEFRKKIERELAEVRRAVVVMKKEPKAEELEGFGDNTPLSEEMDAITSTESRELQFDRLGRLLDRAAALDEALHRMDEGLFGKCVSCEKPIAKERLEAVPEAARCNRCQEALEGSSNREEPRESEWRSVQEVFASRESFDEEGFERRPRELENVASLVEKEDES